jgi:hypothetical protein
MANLGTITLRLPDQDALEREYEDHLRHGRAFVAGATEHEPFAPVKLVLVHPRGGADLTLRAQVVMVARDTPEPGVGVELCDFDEDAALALADFVGRPRAARRDAHIYDRLRGMPVAEQQKLARAGDLGERVALERVFSKTVWEALLANPRITLPEVARIARKGTVPRPILDQIVDHAVWAKTPPVRRALLSNPRIGSETIDKLLRATPKRELKLIERQTIYPSAVREAARQRLAP